MKKMDIISVIKNSWYIPVVIGVTVCLNLFVFRFGVTIGDSMYPTLKNGNPLFISLTEKIERKDIIIFKSEEYDENMVKRVIGLPGDTVQIKGNKIYINGEVISDSVSVEMVDYGIAANPVVLKENEYFVMGDNRNNSLDSRVFGPITKDSILGKVKFCLSPFKELG